MKVQKKVSIGGEFAKLNEDFKDGDIIEILNEGVTQEGEFGTQFIFKVKCVGGEKILSFNQTSRNNIIDVYGDETEKWIGKKVKVWVLRQNVQGKIKPVVYLTHPNATPEEPTPSTKPWRKEVDEEEIDPKDIPF